MSRQELIQLIEQARKPSQSSDFIVMTLEDIERLVETVIEKEINNGNRNHS